MQPVCNLRVYFSGAIYAGCSRRHGKEPFPREHPFSRQRGRSTAPGTGPLKERGQLDFFVVDIVDTSFVDIADHAVPEAERADAELDRNPKIYSPVEPLLFLQLSEAFGHQWINDRFEIIMTYDPLVMPPHHTLCRREVGVALSTIMRRSVQFVRLINNQIMQLQKRDVQLREYQIFILPRVPG